MFMDFIMKGAFLLFHQNFSPKNQGGKTRPGMSDMPLFGPIQPGFWSWGLPELGVFT